ncbi:MAG: hypothetical protein M1819_000383 [Sarea resinae]|nr:MAG: hypothetical protein M1819_000383 [Sarea resinae]
MMEESYYVVRPPQASSSSRATTASCRGQTRLQLSQYIHVEDRLPSMKKTLLLCFIHGFKGGDDTFGGFPEHLRALLSHALPKVKVEVITYPKFETKGDLRECVAGFKNWYDSSLIFDTALRESHGGVDANDLWRGRLQNKVIDMEVENGTPSPTIEPSVRTVLVGHSMGGIVAADTTISIANEQPVSDSTEPSLFMFPYIQGILAFDTPYLGIAPSVVAHGAEEHYKNASTAYSTISQVGSLFGWGASSSGSSSSSQAVAKVPKALPSSGDAAAAPLWQRWGKVAMFAGAAGAVAAGGAAAYMNRDQIAAGWTFLGSHLEFVGCLMRGEELKKRVARISKLESDRGLGFTDLYTTLGAAAQGKALVTSGLMGSERTFCSLPKSEVKKYFLKAQNDAATDEMRAHMNMFSPKNNPGYYALAEKATELVSGWVAQGSGGPWYEESEGPEEGAASGGSAARLMEKAASPLEKEPEIEEAWLREDKDEASSKGPESGPDEVREPEKGVEQGPVGPPQEPSLSQPPADTAADIGSTEPLPPSSPKEIQMLDPIAEPESVSESEAGSAAPTTATGHEMGSA